ncbi:MAG TPA: SxtJ family membrane protein [Gemmatimonadaceae bacterium]|nr:SxtJ family membrane protein [Gemmatimonadaceae bacterium]
MRRRRDPARDFAFVFAVLAAVIGLAPLVHRGTPRFAALGVTIVLLMVGLFAPRILSVPARAWLALAGLLNRTVSAVVLAIIYVVVITPTGLYRRLSKKDALQREFDPTAPTYWTDREEPGPRAETLPRQY